MKCDHYLEFLQVLLRYVHYRVTRVRIDQIYWQKKRSQGRDEYRFSSCSFWKIYFSVSLDLVSSEKGVRVYNEWVMRILKCTTFFNFFPIAYPCCWRVSGIFLHLSKFYLQIKELRGRWLQKQSALISKLLKILCCCWVRTLTYITRTVIAVPPIADELSVHPFLENKNKTALDDWKNERFGILNNEVPWETDAERSYFYYIVLLLLSISIVLVLRMIVKRERRYLNNYFVRKRVCLI